MNILITGHKGFVGKHYVKYFTRFGHNITGIDIKDGNDCRDFFKTCDNQFDLIIHLAAIVGGRDTIENDPLSVATDLSIDSEFFNWAVRTKQTRIIYFSSSAAYPIHLQMKGSNHKLKESDIDLMNISSPDFTYGWSKLSGEYLAHFARQYGIKVHVFRPFSGYGETQDLDYPFPSFIQRVINEVDNFEIWGDGTQVRDFIHIDDIVEATMKAIELDIQEPINLGNSVPVSFNELAELMFDIYGWKPKKGIIHKTDKPVGVMYRCSDNIKLLDFYTPKITLRDGIIRSLNHSSNNIKR
jgi:nucleoside-diphosphate-sugar epimerase